MQASRGAGQALLKDQLTAAAGHGGVGAYVAYVRTFNEHRSQGLLVGDLAAEGAAEEVKVPHLVPLTPRTSQGATAWNEHQPNTLAPKHPPQRCLTIPVP